MRASDATDLDAFASRFDLPLENDSSTSSHLTSIGLQAMFDGSPLGQTDHECILHDTGTGPSGRTRSAATFDGLDADLSAASGLLDNAPDNLFGAVSEFLIGREPEIAFLVRHFSEVIGPWLGRNIP